jgi:O-antigen/teichoic acid export membrane protein
VSARRVGRAAYWSTVDTLIRQGGQFFISIVLARLISPEDFGLIALLTIFTTVAALFADGGMSAALIQKQEHSVEDESTVFWFNIIAGTTAAILFGFSAPLIADFFNQPRLISLIWVMAFNLWLSAWLTVHLALLSKKLDFSKQAKASAVSVVISGAIAILLALNEAGVWALAIQAVVSTFINVLMIWWLHGWRPQFVFSRASLGRLFGFGGYVLLTNTIDAVASRLYSIVIGKAYTIHDVGIYNRAVTTRDFVQSAISSSFSRVAFPLFSSRAHSPELLKEGLRKAIQLMMAFNLPIMLGMASVAENLIPLLFGPAWGESVPMMQVLCIAGALWPIHVANINALIAQGHSHQYLRIEILKKAILISATVIGAYWGLMAIAWAALFASAAGLVINTYYTKKQLDYSLAAQLYDISPYIISSVVMMIMILMTKMMFIGATTYITVLLLEVTIAALTYPLMLHILGADREILDYLNKIRARND